MTEEVDRQWVKTKEEADQLRERLRKTAAKAGMTIAIEPAGSRPDDGYNVIVRKP